MVQSAVLFNPYICLFICLYNSHISCHARREHVVVVGVGGTIVGGTMELPATSNEIGFEY